MGSAPNEDEIVGSTSCRRSGLSEERRDPIITRLQSAKNNFALRISFRGIRLLQPCNIDIGRQNDEHCLEMPRKVGTF